MKPIISKSVLLTTLAFGLVTRSEADSMRHGIAAGEAGKFCGWPANNGVWTWDNGKEILVGYSYQDFVEQKGHNIKGLTGTSPDIITRLARSTDGGLTWKSEDPENFVGDGKPSVPCPGGIDFKSPGFAMRVVGIGYHGAYDTNGHFFVSYDHGKDWQGPYQFNGLMENPILNGKDNTSRTGYVVTGTNSCLLFMSTRGKESSDDFMDKTYVAETTDGGKTFRFVSWVIPLDDPFRAVMPAVSQLADGTIVATLRRRDLKNDKWNKTKPCWVDCYTSTDNGRTWSFTSRVGETGLENGNPPALAALHDGRIVCVYGNRSNSKILARISADGGKTWEGEVVLRDDFQRDKFGDNDLGYPRVAVNHENHVVALYYWATKERPQHHIAATIWPVNPDFGILPVGLLNLMAHCAFGMAPMADHLGLIPPDATTHAFRAIGLRCQDGQNMPGVSSLPAGDTATGVLRSKPFECPPRLSFWLAGTSRAGKNSLRLVDDATSQELRRQTPPGGMPARPYTWDLSDLNGRLVRLELVDDDDATSNAWIALCGIEPEVARLPRAAYNIVTQVRDDAATAMAQSDWEEMPQPATEINADGIPFLQGYWWSPRGEGESFTLDGLNLQTRALHLLGCVNSVDQSYANWGGGNGRVNYFIGDQIGTLTITYASGQADEIPLVFGYTAWWRENYNSGYAPFKTDPKDRALLDRALCVANGIKGGHHPYYLTIALRDEPVAALRFDDNPDKAGYPVVRGLTFESIIGGAENIDEMRFKRFSSPLPAPAADINAQDPEKRKMLEWRGAHTIRSDDPLPVERQQALEAVQRRLYTFADQITPGFIAGVRPDTPVESFAGPKVRFQGPAEADLLTNIFLDNAADHATRIGEDGMLHESAEKSPNFMGCAGWRPDMQLYHDKSFTRQRSLVTLSQLGFAEIVEKAIDYYDHWLMYYPRAWPEVQLGGKPVPGHWSVICNMPHIYFDKHRTVGWPTKYKVRDFGNPENDGHGLTMLAHYTAWNKQGRTKDWVETRWAALNEAAEYIPWCLDNPDLSFSEHGLLYNESEGGMMKASLYCDYPCWLALLAYAEMAEAAGKADKAGRWRELAGRLFRAMEAYYPARDETWGEIWPRDKTCELGHATLAPVFFGSQFLGFDVVNRLPEGWAERTRNTYRMELERTQPRHAAPSSLGYGQAYITQSALLLDQMADAAKMTAWMARLCFYPGLEHPYRVPESAVTQSDGSMWWRRGDLGNTYQQAEVLYTTTIMVGVDDLDAKCLKIMPRLPSGWTGLEVNDWPARATSGGASKLVKIGYQLVRADADQRLELKLTADRPLDQSRVRLGPFPATARTLRMTINGQPVNTTMAPDGDSSWAWIGWPAGLTRVRIEAFAEQQIKKTDKP